MRGAPPPPPIIFERLKLPQQIIYRRKENLSESPNHQKYWENILVSRFYEQFSRNRRNLGHFRKFEKISNSQNMNILYIILKHVIWRFQIYNLFREDKSNNVFREIRKCITSPNSRSIAKCSLDFQSHVIHGYGGIPHYFLADAQRQMAHLRILSLHFRGLKKIAAFSIIYLLLSSTCFANNHTKA